MIADKDSLLPRIPLPHKLRTGVIIGTVVALGGIILRLSAQKLAMEWQGNFGSPDPAKVSAYRDIALAFLGAGLVVLVITFKRWLDMETASKPQDEGEKPG